jgi:hypothetical protein
MITPPPTPSHARLADSIEDLYRVFSAKAPRLIEGCPCCIDTRKVDVLLSNPLRELNGDQLWRYITGAYLTVGGDRDFRYLMPRIFELAAVGPFGVPDTEIVLGKLALARWETWKAAEREAILEFIDAWFSTALEQDLLYAEDGWIDQTQTILCGMARAGLPLADWLIRLTEPAHEPILADLRQRYPRGLSPFWDDAPSGFAQLSMVLAEGAA